MKRGTRTTPLLVALKGRIEPQEIAELPVQETAVSVKNLHVPGRDYRHAVIIDCTKA